MKIDLERVSEELYAIRQALWLILSVFLRQQIDYRLFWESKEDHRLRVAIANDDFVKIIRYEKEFLDFVSANETRVLYEYFAPKSGHVFKVYGRIENCETERHIVVWLKKTPKTETHLVNVL